MRVPVFVVAFVLMLLGSQFNSFAGLKVNTKAFSATTQVTTPEAKVLNYLDRNSGSIHTWNLPADDKLIDCEDAEDENHSQAFLKKYKSLTGFYADAFYKCCRQSSPAIPASFRSSWPYISAIYIFQRSIRI